MITLDSLIISTTFVDMPLQGVVMYYTDKNITIIDIDKLSKNTRLKTELDNHLLNYVYRMNLEFSNVAFGDYLPDKSRYSDYLKILAIDAIPVSEIDKIPFKKPVVSTKITRRTIRKKPTSAKK
jgi:hypothetical protein